MSLAAVSTTLTAKKSWFMFDDEIVCLGAGITCGGPSEVDTTVEDRRLGTTPTNHFTIDGISIPPITGWSSNFTTASWCALDGVAGYYFPSGITNLRAAFAANTGSWSDINNGSYVGTTTTPYTDDYLTLWFNHGIKPANNSYAYVILPNFSASQTATYATNPDIVILTNTPTVQAVSKPLLEVVAANFWTDGTNSANIITANKKCSVIALENLHGITVGVSDPTQTNSSTIQITLNHPAISTLSADPGVTVLQLSPKIVISINVNGSLGRTFQASFHYPAPTIHWDANINVNGAQDGSGSWNNSNSNWWIGGTNISWNDALPFVATFGTNGIAGTISITGAHHADALLFNPVAASSYLLTGNDPLTIGNGITANAMVTLNVPLVLGTNQT